MGPPKETPRFRLRRLVRVLLTDLKFQQAQVRHDARAASAMQQQTRFLANFNLEPFLRQANVCKLTERHRAILRTPVAYRTHKQARELTHVVKQLKAFERYSDMNHLALARILHYDCFLPNTVLLKQGHRGLAFYLIVSGRVGVQVRDGAHKDGVRIINELGPGDSFGELALMEENNIRTATIICTTPCEFLRVNRHEFNSILKESHRRELAFKEGALRHPSAFGTWREAALADLLTHAHRRPFKQGDVIFNGVYKGEAEHFVVVVATGSVRLLRSLPVRVSTGRGSLVPASNRTRQHRRQQQQQQPLQQQQRQLCAGGKAGLGSRDGGGNEAKRMTRDRMVPSVVVEHVAKGGGECGEARRRRHDGHGNSERKQHGRRSRDKGGARRDGHCCSESDCGDGDRRQQHQMSVRSPSVVAGGLQRQQRRKRQQQQLKPTPPSSTTTATGFRRKQHPPAQSCASPVPASQPSLSAPSSLSQTAATSIGDGPGRHGGGGLRRSTTTASAKPRAGATHGPSIPTHSSLAPSSLAVFATAAAARPATTAATVEPSAREWGKAREMQPTTVSASASAAPTPRPGRRVASRSLSSSAPRFLPPLHPNHSSSGGSSGGRGDDRGKRSSVDVDHSKGVRDAPHDDDVDDGGGGGGSECTEELFDEAGDRGGGKEANRWGRSRDDNSDNGAGDDGLRYRRCKGPHVWVTTDPLPAGTVLASWKDEHALVSEGCECVFLPRAVFYKFEKGRQLINAHTIDEEQGGVRSVVFMLRASDTDVFDTFKRAEQWEYFKFCVSPTR